MPAFLGVATIGFVNGAKLYLGIDGGQSSTKALIGDEAGRILGEGTGGPCNHARKGEGRARLERGLRDSVDAACEMADLDFSSVEFEAACLGMSGGPDDKREIAAGILRALRLEVTGDAEIALAGATPGGQGIIVIAGTGSISLGRNAQGQTARAGGWGYIFGDEGSAFDLVRRALRSALRMEEGWGPPTALRQILLDATGSRDAGEALHSFYREEWPRSRVAALAPLVETAAENGDAAAAEALAGSARELAFLAGAVREQLWTPGEPVNVAYAGGLFRSRQILERFRLLVELNDGVRCAPPLRTPAEGALLEAYRLAGLEFAALSRAT